MTTAADMTPTQLRTQRATPAVLEHMERHGSHFAAALAKAWQRADGRNSAALMREFGTLYADTADNLAYFQERGWKS